MITVAYSDVTNKEYALNINNINKDNLQPFGTAGRLIFENSFKDIYCTVTIKNSVFIQSGNGKDKSAINCRNVILNLNGPLVFTNFKSENDSIIIVERVNVTIHGHVEFLNNNAVSLLSKIGLGSIQFKESFLLNISNNKFYEEIFTIFSPLKCIIILYYKNRIRCASYSTSVIMEI